MIAWGFRDGFKFGHLSPVQFAQKVKDLGYKWAALELDDYDNAGRWGPFRFACQSLGLKSGPWFTSGDVSATPPDADFTIAEVESEEKRLKAIASAPSLPPGMRKAIITNFTPMTDGQGVPQPEKAAPLIALGYECLTECYMGDSGGNSLNPDEMNFRATVQLGWPRSQPVFGVYNKPLAEYGPFMGKWPAYGLYLAEYVV
jgi:hypothetical protein